MYTIAPRATHTPTPIRSSTIVWELIFRLIHLVQPTENISPPSSSSLTPYYLSAYKPPSVTNCTFGVRPVEHSLWSTPHNHRCTEQHKTYIQQRTNTLRNFKGACGTLKGKTYQCTKTLLWGKTALVGKNHHKQHTLSTTIYSHICTCTVNLKNNCSHLRSSWLLHHCPLAPHQSDQMVKNAICAILLGGREGTYFPVTLNLCSGLGCSFLQTQYIYISTMHYTHAHTH